MEPPTRIDLVCESLVIRAADGTSGEPDCTYPEVATHHRTPDRAKVNFIPPAVGPSTMDMDACTRRTEELRPTARIAFRVVFYDRGLTSQ